MPENPFIARRRKQSEVPNMQSMLRRRVARKPGDTYGFREPFPMDNGGLSKKRSRQPTAGIPRGGDSGRQMPQPPNWWKNQQGQKGPIRFPGGKGNFFGPGGPDDGRRYPYQPTNPGPYEDIGLPPQPGPYEGIDLPPQEPIGGDYQPTTGPGNGLGGEPYRPGLPGQWPGIGGGGKPSGGLGGGSGNPNQPGPNQNPSQHKPYWEAQGWQWNGQQFVRRSPGGRPNPQGPGGGGGGGGGGGRGPGGPKPGPKPNEPGGGGNNPPLEPGPPVPPGTPLDQLPLDAWFEAQRRMLDDQLSQRMAALSPLEQQIMAQKGLGEARLGTNEDLAGRSMREALAGRGMFGGGVQARDEGNLATDFMRQRQDLASGVAGQLSDVALQRSEAQGNYSSGLQEALLALAQRMAEDENAPVVVPPAPGAERPPGPKPKPPKKGRKPPTKGGTKPPPKKRGRK